MVIPVEQFQNITEKMLDELPHQNYVVTGVNTTIDHDTIIERILKNLPKEHLKKILKTHELTIKAIMEEEKAITQNFASLEESHIMDLKRKVKQHCDTLDYTDQMFRGAIPKYIVAGGWFASVLRNEEPKDFDIFFLDCDMDTALADKINIQHIKMHKVKTRHEISYLQNENVVAVVDHNIFHIKYQFIFTKYKTREELVNHFDFLHTCVSYDAAAEKLFISKPTYDAIMKKKLIPNPNARKDPSSWRWVKFIDRGWNK
jgi:hypothetical protein